MQTKGPLVKMSDRGFNLGYNPITSMGEPSLDTGIDFGIYLQDKDDVIVGSRAKECVWILMQGKVLLEAEGIKYTAVRNNIFEEAPTALHTGPDTPIKITALSDKVEWALSTVGNSKTFAPLLFKPKDLKPEFRGAGLVGGTCLRNVRLIFDQTNRPESNLVIGEVVNLPGRWSSYPPHHHEQPEIYHYRFTLPQGYGHAELGDNVYKVRHGDTIKITQGLDHAQCAAPGYGMYYLWVIRHLDDRPYTGFTFTKEHEWLLDPKNQGWVPKGFG